MELHAFSQRSGCLRSGAGLVFGLVVGVLVLVSTSTSVHAEETTPPPPTKHCVFYCNAPASGGRPAGEPIQAPAQPACTTDNDCVTACTDRCPHHGPSDPNSEGQATNGLNPTQGSDLQCFNPTGANTARKPRCVDGATAAPTNTPNAPGSTSATSAPSAGAVELTNPLGRNVTSIPELFGRIVRAFMGILGALAMFWFVWGGILWMTAEESKRAEEAQTIMKNATLGLFLIFFAYGLTTMFLSLFEEVASRSTGTTPASTRSTTTSRPANTTNSTGAPNTNDAMRR